MSRNQDNNAADAALKAAQAQVDELMRQLREWPTARETVAAARELHKWQSLEQRERIDDEKERIEIDLQREQPTGWARLLARIGLAPKKSAHVRGLEARLADLAARQPVSFEACLAEAHGDLCERRQITAARGLAHLVNSLHKAVTTLEQLKCQCQRGGGAPPPLTLAPIEPPTPPAGGGTGTGGAGQQHRPPGEDLDASQVLDDLPGEGEGEQDQDDGAADRPRGG